MTKIRTVALAVIFPVSILAMWEVMARKGMLPPSHSASPTDIGRRFLQLVFAGPLLRHCAYSMFRLCFGVLLGTIAGVISGILLAKVKVIERLFGPSIQWMAGIPVVVWIPFWVMLLGTEEMFKIAMGGISTFFLVNLHTVTAVRSVQRTYIELADMYEKTLLQKIRHIFLPHATPFILTSIRASLALAWIVVFFVEYASARQGSEGLGWYIADARAVGKVEDEFSGLLMLAFLAWGSDLLVARLYRTLMKWEDAPPNLP